MIIKNIIPPDGDKLRIEIIESGEVRKIVALPVYGEVKIICHNGKITFIETTVKEKVD